MLDLALLASVPLIGFALFCVWRAISALHVPVDFGPV